MRLPLIGQVVCVPDDQGKQFPAIIVDVEDVPYGQAVGVKLFVMYSSGYSTDPQKWWYQGNNKGEWQWPDIPIQ